MSITGKQDLIIPGSVFAMHAELAFIKAWQNLFTPGMMIRMMTQDDLFGADMIPQ